MILTRNCEAVFNRRDGNKLPYYVFTVYYKKKTQKTTLSYLKKLPSPIHKQKTNQSSPVLWEKHRHGNPVCHCVCVCILTELPGCAALRCGPDARCFEDTTFGKLVCKCQPGYFGDGVQCTCKYSCDGSARSCSLPPKRATKKIAL